MNERPEGDDDAAVRKAIGKKIRTRREALGLSQSGLARLLRTRAGTPLAPSQLSKWERGENMPSRWYWPQLADALDTTVSALFGGIADDGSDGELDQRVDELEARLAALIRVLDVKDAVDGAVRARATAARITPQAPPVDDESGEPGGERRWQPPGQAGGEAQSS